MGDVQHKEQYEGNLIEKTVFELDGLEFSKQEILKAIKDLENIIKVKREMVLQDHWTKKTCIDSIKVSQKRLLELQALISWTVVEV